jgi:hypothetical protein
LIKFHYHAAPKDVPHADIEKGDPLCHAYSDTSLEELVAWGRAHGLQSGWIDRKHTLPHFDLHGESLAYAGEGVGRRELVRDIRRWRKREEES